MGILTFSSNDPEAPAQVIVASFPIICAHTISTASGITGFTFPGIMDEPGCRSGRFISPKPVFGPDPIQRRSLFIFVKLTAMVFKAAEASTKPSRFACASKWFVASVRGSLVSWASSLMTFCENPFGVFMPVPTAVPPNGISFTRGSVVWMRFMP